MAIRHVQEQGSRIAAAAHLNYEFAMYKRRPWKAGQGTGGVRVSEVEEQAGGCSALRVSPTRERLPGLRHRPAPKAAKALLRSGLLFGFEKALQSVAAGQLLGGCWRRRP